MPVIEHRKRHVGICNVYNTRSLAALARHSVHTIAIHHLFCHANCAKPYASRVLPTLVTSQTLDSIKLCSTNSESMITPMRNLK